MTQIVHERGKFRPILCCDTCRQQITNYRRAVVTWDEPGHPRYVHMGVCDPRPGTPGRDPYSCGLAEHLLGLLANCGLKLRFKNSQVQVPAGIVTPKQIETSPSLLEEGTKP